MQSSILGKDPRPQGPPMSNGHPVVQPNAQSELSPYRNDEAKIYEQQLRSLRSQLILSEDKCNGLNKKLEKLAAENLELLERYSITTTKYKKS